MKKMLKAEWIPYMSAYRVYDDRSPSSTVAYENNKDDALANGCFIVEE